MHDCVCMCASCPLYDTIRYVGPVPLETIGSTSCSSIYYIHLVYAWMILCHGGGKFVWGWTEEVGDSSSCGLYNPKPHLCRYWYGFM